MTPPIWYTTAQKYLGVKEIPGAKSNPAIVGWAARLGGWFKSFYTKDETPWCGLFVAHVMREAVPSIKLPSNPFSALAWASWGVSLASPTIGAILVFKRSGGGHVGYYVGEDATCFHVLGGNQGDAVSVTRIEKNRLVATRWPSVGVLPDSGRVWLSGVGKPSTNEA